jgi:hypothetical protein
VRKQNSIILICALASLQIFGQSPKMYSKNEILKDIDYLVNDIEAIHPNLYHSVSKDDFSRKIKIIKDLMPDSVNKTEAWKRLNEIFASINEGHTTFRPPATKSLQIHSGIKSEVFLSA